MPEGRRERTKRADAVRNRDAIIEAAVSCLSENPAAGMSEIARVAGVGRVTLYGHFTDRSQLVGAVFARAMDLAEAELAAVDTAQDPWESMQELVQSAWRTLYQYHSLMAAAEPYFSADQIRAHHDKPLARVTAVLQKGRHEGAFRRDQPLSWQVACFYAILHSAAAEIRAGRLTEADIATVLPATIRDLLVPPVPPRDPRGR